MDNGFYMPRLDLMDITNIRTKKYPKGQPNQLIARVVESGSTYMDKTPFMRKAPDGHQGEGNAENAGIIDDEFKKLMK